MPEIYKANLSQWTEVFKIVDSCSNWLLKRGITHWAKYYTEQRIIYKIVSTNVFIIDDDLPLGTITLSTESPDYYTQEDIQKFAGARGIYITTLAVKPEFQGQGYASELLEFAARYALKNKCKYLRLDTRDFDTTLLNFYLHRGFVIKGKLTSPSDRFLLEKAL